MFSRPPVQPVRNPQRRARGFSLIEALIAVVVLSTGLLALAALQSALIRSSVDARIRSSAAAAAVSIFEDLRAGSYDTLAFRVTAINSATPGAAGALNYVQVDPAATGGFQVNIDTEAWYDKAGVFVKSTDDPFDPNTDPQPLGEFTQADVTVTWTDPTGAGGRSITFNDIVGPLASFNVNPDTSRLGGTIVTEKPIVRTNNPEGPGVIPIAIGDGSESAATNPKPIIAGNKSGVIETRFNVLTFAPAGLEALIQKRVETSVVGCRCVVGGGVNLSGIFAAAVRPTFWDGTRYVPPKPTGVAAPAGPDTDNRIIQSRLCDDCCRDHNDPTGLGVDDPRFDPFRSDGHVHFKLDNSGMLVAAGSDQYREACRLIRVDGLWRVAADMRNEFFGLLKTSAKDGIGDPATDPVPDTAAAGLYEEFVLQTLDKRFISKSLSSDPAVAQATLRTDYANKGLDIPTNLNIARAATDKRWLHARGLYIDHVESDAEARIEKAKQDCTKAGTPLSSCNILSFVPFTTINLTELSEWQPIAGPTISVTNTSTDAAEFVLAGNPTNPVRGRVSAFGSPPDGVQADAIAEIARSNSGVAIVTPIDPEDRDQFLDDRQRFTVGGGGSTTGQPFELRMGGTMPRIGDGSPGNDPKADSVVSGDVQPCSPGGPDEDPIREYACPTNSPLNNVPASVVIRNYNISGLVNEAVICTDGTKSATENVDRPVCKNYGIGSAFVNGSPLIGPFTVTGSASLAEQTRINIPSLAPNDVVEAVFEFEGETRPAIAACKVGGTKIISISFDSCP